MSDATTTPAPAVPAVPSPELAAATSPAPAAEGDESSEQQHEGLTLRALVSSKEAGKWSVLIVGWAGEATAISAQLCWRIDSLKEADIRG